MFAYLEYKGVSIPVQEHAGTLIVEIEDGYLCQLSQDQVKALLAQTSEQNEGQANHKNKLSPSLYQRRGNLRLASINGRNVNGS